MYVGSGTLEKSVQSHHSVTYVGATGRDAQGVHATNPSDLIPRVVAVARSENAR
jgi:hypothetical protein